MDKLTEDCRNLQLQKQEFLDTNREGGLPSLDYDVFIHIAQHLPAKDYLQLRQLCRGVRACIPGVPLLNLKYFKDSFMKFLKDEELLNKNKRDSVKEDGKDSSLKFRFTLNPMEATKDPLALLGYVAQFFSSVNNCDDKREVLHERWFKGLAGLLGKNLELAVLEVLKKGKDHHHPYLSLHLVVYSKSIPIIQYLLSQSTFISDQEYQLSMYIACLGGSSEVLEVLLQDERANPASNNNIAIQIVSADGYTQCVKLLLEDERVNPADANNFAVRLAVTHGRIEVYNLLIQDPRVNPSDSNNECIINACRNGSTDLVKLLLADTRVNPATLTNECLREACAGGFTEIVKLLLKDQRVSPNERENECIRISAAKGFTEVCRILLDDRRVDASAKNNSALHFAVRNNHQDVVNLLKSGK